MVATPSLMAELKQRGFANLGMWTRGVDIELFRPDRANKLEFPRPIFVNIGGVAVEKNLDAFLSLDLPGTKLVIGTGPQEAELRHRFPDAKFLGLIENEKLAAHLAASDLFVFPSISKPNRYVRRRSTRSPRQRVPIAAFAVTGPKDVIGNNSIGVLSDDLRAACLVALHVSRDACRAFALNCSWDISARQFIGHLKNVAASGHARNLRYSRGVGGGVQEGAIHDGLVAQ